MQQQYADIQPYIPFHIRLKLYQLDVHLDKSWHSTLVNIFINQSQEVNQLIYEQILKPKGIIFDNTIKKFVNTIPRLSLNGLLPQLTTPQTRHLAQQLTQSLDRIAQEDNIIVVGEYLESIIDQINQIHTDDQPILNKEKKLIKTHFLYDIDLIISHNHYKTPHNSRGLTEHQIKSFISDVYIKNQISDYISNSIRSQALKLKNSPIIDYIIEERKTRLFEVYEGIEYYYLVTPTNYNEDLYSIRRFLHEEPSLYKNFYYLNGLVIDKCLIHENNDTIEQQNTLNKIKQQIQCFVSINKSVSPQLIDFIESIDIDFQNKILPLLEITLNPKIKYRLSVIERLFELEQSISIYFLQKIMYAIQHIASNKDDFEYLYTYSLLLFSNLIFSYETFQNQPALFFNHQAKEFKYRLIAWIKIIQKRKSEIFQHLNREDLQQQHQSSQQLINIILNILNDALKTIRNTNKNIKITEKELQDIESSSFLKRLFNKKEKIEQQLIQLNTELIEIKRFAFLEIIKQTKQYTKNIVYLEYENMIGITDTHRHYAINIGINGFTRLPILIQLPEDKRSFDVGETYQSLVKTLSSLNQTWNIEEFEQVKK